MEAPYVFVDWFFNGLSGLGGWCLFALLALVADAWIFFDSRKRHFKALGWKIGVVLLTLLAIPVIIYRFAPFETHLDLLPFQEVLFYLGLLCGVLPVFLDVSYYISFQDLSGCPKGHVFAASTGKCPVCSPLQDSRTA